MGLCKGQLEVGEHDYVLKTIYQILGLSPMMWWITLLSNVLSLLYYKLKQFEFQSEYMMVLRSFES